jgi:chromatin remodeling complex protein RSC6
MPAKQSVPKTKSAQSVETVQPVAAIAIAPTKTKATKTVAAPVQEETVADVPVQEAPTRKRGGRKAAAPSEPSEKEVDHPAIDIQASDEPATKERVTPTSESVHTDFSELITELEQQIAQLRDSSDKTGSAKYLRGILRRVKTLQSSCSRVMRRRQPTKRVNNNSGFLKPVQISPEIAKFTGLEHSSLHSRVDVTKRVCDYIKEKNLQNPEDKRQIIADPALAKILGYDVKKADKPLTYYHIQTLLKDHFVSSKKE